jgi:hypothetical protein
VNSGPSEAKSAAGIYGFIQTRFGCALLFVLLLNVCFSAAFPALKVKAAELPSSHCWEWWRARSFLKQDPAPDVVLLGSSLMMIPVSVLDADYLHKDLDAVYHDHSVYMEQALARTGKNSTCFNFAIPGGMISDDYMVERALLLDDVKRTKLIVLGITLRDFLESHVPCAASTNSFKYFRHYFDVDDIVELAMPEFWQRFDYWQSKLVYMVGRRLDLQVAYEQTLASICNKLLGAPTAKVENVADRQLTFNVAHNLKTEAEPGDFVLHAGQIYPYEDNSSEYRKRFSSPSRKLFNTEVEFFKRILVQAQNHNVRVLLVNMPLTPANMGLMPPGFYAEYLNIARAQASQFACPFLDLNDGHRFDVSDFRDTAHMNSGGGKKLLDAVVAAIDKEPTLAAALTARDIGAASSAHAAGSAVAGPVRQLAGRGAQAASGQVGAGAL